MTSPKAAILNALSASRLRELADIFALDGPRRAKTDLTEAFLRYRRISAASILEQLRQSTGHPQSQAFTCV